MNLTDAIENRAELEKNLLRSLGTEPKDRYYDFAERPTDPGERFIVGVAPNRDSDGYHLVVRLQRNDGTAKRAVKDLLAELPGDLERMSVVSVIQSLTPTAEFEPHPKRGAANVARMLREEARPIRPGLSIGTSHTGGGTLGGFVRTQDDEVALLTTTTALFGGRLFSGEVGDFVYQPSRTDSSPLKASNRIARVADFVEIHPTGVNQVDAGIAKLNPDIDFNPTLPAFDGFNYSDRAFSSEIDENQILGLGREARLFKLGRTTGFTRGYISAFALSPTPVMVGNRLYDFDNLIEITSTNEPFSGPGDVGALVFSEDPFGVVGLLVAAGRTGDPTSHQAQVSFACPISTAMNVLNLTWVI